MFNTHSLSIGLLVLTCLLIAPELHADEGGRSKPTTCTYKTYTWSSAKRRTVDHKTVKKSYSKIGNDERDPDNPKCTVCSEDQVTVDPAELGIEGVKPIKVCYVYADKVKQALKTIHGSGEFKVVELTGYRVGRTRGRIVNGLRTKMSNHSFGTAIDINAKHNGLYSKCNIPKVTVKALAKCARRHGGDWDPKRRPKLTITSSGIVYKTFLNNVGWKWGGEISGNTRDMMHFSITGF